MGAWRMCSGRLVACSARGDMSPCEWPARPGAAVRPLQKEQALSRKKRPSRRNNASAHAKKRRGQLGNYCGCCSAPVGDGKGRVREDAARRGIDADGSLRVDFAVGFLEPHRERLDHLLLAAGRRCGRDSCFGDVDRLVLFVRFEGSVGAEDHSGARRPSGGRHLFGSLRRNRWLDVSRPAEGRTGLCDRAARATASTQAPFLTRSAARPNSAACLGRRGAADLREACTQDPAGVPRCRLPAATNNVSWCATWLMDACMHPALAPPSTHCEEKSLFTHAEPPFALRRPHRRG